MGEFFFAKTIPWGGLLYFEGCFIFGGGLVFSAINTLFPSSPRLASSSGGRAVKPRLPCRALMVRVCCLGSTDGATRDGFHRPHTTKYYVRELHQISSPKNLHLHFLMFWWAPWSHKMPFLMFPTLWNFVLSFSILKIFSAMKKNEIMEHSMESSGGSKKGGMPAPRYGRVKLWCVHAFEIKLICIKEYLHTTHSNMYHPSPISLLHSTHSLA